MPCTASSKRFWALLVMSSQSTGETSLYATIDYMHHVISEHYDFDGIYYLHQDNSIPGVNATATLNNTRWAITNWLKNSSGPDDVIFIYFMTHGGGYYDNGPGNPYSPPDPNICGRTNQNETDGYDECLILYGQGFPEYYWDDELANDLNTLSYSKLVLATQSCFGGGLIADVVSPDPEKRVVLTATGESITAYMDLDDDLYCEWTEVFADALHGEDTYWSAATHTVVHQNATVEADINDDGHVTMWEAHSYAKAHDDATNATIIDELIEISENWWAVPETPLCSSRPVAQNVWFPRKGGPRLLTVQACLTNGTELTGVDFWIDDDPITFNTPKTVDLPTGNHSITVQDSFYVDAHEYVFKYWNYNSSSSNPLNLTVLENLILTAYYGGDGGGCPFVHVWNGKEYLIDNNLLPFSETSNGVDVWDYYRLEQDLVARKGKYKLMINEFEQEQSFLDYVQLIAVNHESDVNIAVSPYGEILTYKEPSPPAAAIDSNNADVTSLLESADGSYFEGYVGNYLLLDFGNLDIQHGARLVIRADLPPEDEKWCVRVQVLNDTGSWETVATVIPRAYWATEIVDLHSYLPDIEGNLNVRLYFTAHHKIDFVGLDVTKQDEFELYHANLVSAVHSVRGDVKSELLAVDFVHAELLPGEHIELEFTLPENTKDTRTYIIQIRGHYHTIPP